MQQVTGEKQALAVYGTLAPGEPNHWVVSRIKGSWEDGWVLGYVFEITWGAAEGYQGFLPDNDAGEVPVSVLRADDLSKKWREIDDFEGSGYERSQVQVRLAGGETISAHIYVALTEN